MFDTITLVPAAMWGVPWCLYICIASKMGLLAQRDTRDTYYNAIVSTQLSCQTIHNLCQTFLIFCVDIKTVYAMPLYSEYFRAFIEKFSPPTQSWGASEFIVHIRLEWDEGP